jgi:hypothetical protein
VLKDKMSQNNYLCDFTSHAPNNVPLKRHPAIDLWDRPADKPLRLMDPNQKNRVSSLQIVLKHGSPPEMKKAAQRRLKSLLDEIDGFTLKGKIIQAFPSWFFYSGEGRSFLMAATNDWATEMALAASSWGTCRVSP